MIATIVMPKLMLIGGGSIARVAETLGRLGVKRPLVVTDPYMRDSGAISKLTDPLTKLASRSRSSPTPCRTRRPTWSMPGPRSWPKAASTA